MKPPPDSFVQLVTITFSALGFIGFIIAEWEKIMESEALPSFVVFFSCLGSAYGISQSFLPWRIASLLYIIWLSSQIFSFDNTFFRPVKLSGFFADIVGFIYHLPASLIFEDCTPVMRVQVLVYNAMAGYLVTSSDLYLRFLCLALGVGFGSAIATRFKPDSNFKYHLKADYPAVIFGGIGLSIGFWRGIS